MKHIIIIGGGAAGMMAAVAAAKQGAKVTLIEKNEKTGKKIFITGKGRCNLTNACDEETFFASIVSNSKFMYSAFSHMDNQAVVRFFAEAGCPVKEERGGRVFPVSDRAVDVMAALQRQMKKLGVKVLLHTGAKELILESQTGAEEEADGRNKKITGVVLSDNTKIAGDAVIIATGGKSYPSTGSTGEGYLLAESAGHSIRELKPALVPFTVKEQWCMQLQGLSLKNVSAVIKNGKKKIYEGFGEMLFTHFGVSGPLMISASSYYVKKYQNQPVTLTIDLKPALTEEQLDKRLLRDFEENQNRQFKNVLNGLLPSKLIPVMIILSGINQDKKIHELSREERKKLVTLFKNLSMTITGTRDFNEAIITQGGVHTKEINPSTMESKKVKNLYFAGELMDVDALTGGFNLQIAWSTGCLAGSSAAKNTE